VARPTIAVLGTGGTLAGSSASATDNVGYTAAQIGIEAILAGIPGLRDLPLASEQVAQLDSKDMDFATWGRLLARCQAWLARDEVQGVVITHGTDTLEETAYFLHRMLDTAKPVVLTCAMRPATSMSPDGPQNILDALAVASAAGAQGVVAVCAGVVHDAVQVSKVHPYRLDAFASGEAGPLAYVEDGQVRPVRAWVPTAPRALDWPAGAWPRVEIVMNHAGAGGGMVRALVRDGVQGIVVAGTGNGSVAQPLLDALQEAREAGVALVRTTRCSQGPIVRHAGETLPASALSPVKARIELVLDLLRPPARPAPGR